MEHLRQEMALPHAMLKAMGTSHSDVLSHAWCQACAELCLLGRDTNKPDA